MGSNIIDEHQAAAEQTNAFNDQERVVSLAGRKYTWPMPIRRRGRGILRRANPIMLKIIVHDRKHKTPEEVDNLLEAADMMLDFFYSFHPDMREDKQLLDAALESEISEVFAEVVNFVSIPFLKDGALTANEDEVQQNFK